MIFLIQDGGGAASIFRGLDWMAIALMGTLIQIWFPSAMNKC